MPRPPIQKTVVIPLCTDLFLQTDGSTSNTFTELNIPELDSLGPYIESMYVLAITRNRSTQHLWGVYLSTSISGRTYSTPTIVNTEINANGESVGPAFTTVSTFGGLYLRALLGSRNNSGAARETALVSAWLVVTLKT
jgi:hypothetical protein